MAHLTCWMALDDVDVDNGCLWYVPGSHRWGLLERTDLGGELDAVCGALDAEQRAAFEARVPIEARRRRGECPSPPPPAREPRQSLAAAPPRDARQRLRRRRRVEHVGRGPTGDGGLPAGPPRRAHGGPYYPLLVGPAEDFGAFLSSIPTVHSVARVERA